MGSGGHGGGYAHHEGHGGGHEEVVCSIDKNVLRFFAFLTL